MDKLMGLFYRTILSHAFSKHSKGKKTVKKKMKIDNTSNTV